VGVVLAAPVLASLTLGGRYTGRKMLGMDPWPDPEDEVKPAQYPWLGFWKRFLRWVSKINWPKRK